MLKLFVHPHIPIHKQSYVIRVKSQKVDKMFRAMSRRRNALERIVKVKKIFNI
jgi:hypothetical protein